MPIAAGSPRSGTGPSRPAFCAYVEQFLAPPLVPGDVVVLDNLPARRVAGDRQAIAAAGTSVFYLPLTRPT
jgi:hypothetical protein